MNYLIHSKQIFTKIKIREPLQERASNSCMTQFFLLKKYTEFFSQAQWETRTEKLVNTFKKKYYTKITQKKLNIIWKMNAKGRGAFDVLKHTVFFGLEAKTLCMWLIRTCLLSLSIDAKCLTENWTSS